jgi:hypothetical protein
LFGARRTRRQAPGAPEYRPGTGQRAPRSRVELVGAAPVFWQPSAGVGRPIDRRCWPYRLAGQDCARSVGSKAVHSPPPFPRRLVRDWSAAHAGARPEGRVQAVGLGARRHGISGGPVRWRRTEALDVCRRRLDALRPHLASVGRWRASNQGAPGMDPALPPPARRGLRRLPGWPQGQPGFLSWQRLSM